MGEGKGSSCLCGGGRGGGGGEHHLIKGIHKSRTNMLDKCVQVMCFVFVEIYNKITKINMITTSQFINCKTSTLPGTVLYVYNHAVHASSGSGHFVRAQMFMILSKPGALSWTRPLQPVCTGQPKPSAPPLHSLPIRPYCVCRTTGCDVHIARSKRRVAVAVK